MAIFRFKITGSYSVDLADLIEAHGVKADQDEYDLLQDILDGEKEFLINMPEEIDEENMDVVHVDFDDINLARRELDEYQEERKNSAQF